MPEYKLFTNCLLQAMDYVYPRKSMKLNMAMSGWVFEGCFFYIYSIIFTRNRLILFFHCLLTLPFRVLKLMAPDFFQKLKSL